MPGPSGHKGKLMSFVSKAYAVVVLIAVVLWGAPHPAQAQSPDLKSPKDVAGFYTTLYGNQFGNGTGSFIFLMWKGDSTGADTARGGGYRVRRTIDGVSAQPLDIVGQWTTRFQQAPICFNLLSPCPGHFFNFTGGGLYFRGFQGNRRPDGTYSFDYPPGAPQDTCSDCWVFADGAALSGFRHHYGVTVIDTTVIVASDFYETPLDPAEIVDITPGSPVRSNLEEVAVVPNPYKIRAEWEPGDGTRQLRFIRVPRDATIRIFTSSGDLVSVLKASDYTSPGGETGDVPWNLRNDEGRGVVSGIYIYQIETSAGRTRKGHFVIIK